MHLLNLLLKIAIVSLLLYCCNDVKAQMLSTKFRIKQDSGNGGCDNCVKPVGVDFILFYTPNHFPFKLESVTLLDISPNGNSALPLGSLGNPMTYDPIIRPLHINQGFVNQIIDNNSPFLDSQGRIRYVLTLYYNFCHGSNSNQSNLKSGFINKLTVEINNYDQSSLAIISSNNINQNLSLGTDLKCDERNPPNQPISFLGKDGHNNFILNNDNFNIIAYPNPFSTNLNLKGNNLKNSPIEISIIDIIGNKTLLSPSLYIYSHNGREISLNLESFSPGLYNLEIITKSNKHNLRIRKL